MVGASKLNSNNSDSTTNTVKMLKLLYDSVNIFVIFNNLYSYDDSVGRLPVNSQNVPWNSTAFNMRIMLLYRFLKEENMTLFFLYNSTPYLWYAPKFLAVFFVLNTDIINIVRSGNNKGKKPVYYYVFF